MAILKVRNLKKYQHYSDRSPPWIKWHRCCLDDAEFYGLPDGAKWLAVGLVLIASSNGNEIEDHQLGDGDIVEIGKRKFRYRLS